MTSFEVYNDLRGHVSDKLSDLIKLIINLYFYLITSFDIIGLYQVPN